MLDYGAKLYHDFLKGDQEALGQLVEEYANPLILFINTYVKDYHLSEDIMEDCFVDLLVKKPEFRGDSKFRTYLFQMAKNKALNHIKRQKRFTWITEEDASSELKEDSRILGTIIQEENKKVLYTAIKELPEHYAQALQLIYFAELSYEEAAHVMGKSKKQIANYIYRGKKQLEEILGREEAL